jgi:hypothetical protein
MLDILWIVTQSTLSLKMMAKMMSLQVGCFLFKIPVQKEVALVHYKTREFNDNESNSCQSMMEIQRE